jgi:hypothetical protein
MSKRVTKLYENDLIRVTSNQVSNKYYLIAEIGPHKGYVHKTFIVKK